MFNSDSSLASAQPAQPTAAPNGAHDGQMASAPTLLEIAFAYRSRHWSVMPVLRTTSTKKPAVKWKELQDRLPIDEELRQWFTRTDRNIGIVTGAISGFFALDVDGEEGFRAIEAHGGLPETVTTESRPGRRQFWFKHPGHRVANAQKFLPGLDLRGDGGYVQCPPSVHHSGSVYRWINHPDEVPFADAPEWLLDYTRKPESELGQNVAPLTFATLNGHAPTDRETRYAFSALVGECQKVATAPDGDKHKQLLNSAIAVAGFIPCGAIDAGTIEENLFAAIEHRAADKANARETIRDGIRYGKDKPREIPQVTPPAPRLNRPQIGANGDTPASGEVPANDGEDNRPIINADEKDALVFAPVCWAALRESNEKEPRIFRRGHSLIRLEIENDQVALRELTRERLTHEMARCAYFQSTRPKKGEPGEFIKVPAHPPAKFIDDMLAHPAPPVPELIRVVASPVFGPNGELQTERGYHAASRTYYHAKKGFKISPIPEKPTKAQIGAAKKLIHSLIEDFPFVAEADKTHAIAAGLLPYVRDLIGNHPTPLHDFEATAAGTGKGLLIDTQVKPALGESPAVMTQWGDEDECRKRITSVVMEAHPVSVLDNVTKTINSGTYAAALTATLWADRILSKSETIKLPVRCIWLMSANNPLMSTEIARRTIRIRLDAKCERAWQRDDFKIKDLRRYVDENRAEIVAAYLTLIQAWIAAGKPDGGARLASFETWAAVISGILKVAEIPDFLGNLEEFYEETDTEGSAWRALIDAWNLKYGTAEVKASDLFEIADKLDDFPLYGKDEKGRRTSFGTQLKHKRDTVIGDFQVVYVKEGSGRAKIWQLKSTTPHPKPPDSPKTTPENGEPCEPCEPFCNHYADEKNSQAHDNAHSVRLPEGSQGSQGSLNGSLTAEKTEVDY